MLMQCSSMAGNASKRSSQDQEAGLGALSQQDLTCSNQAQQEIGQQDTNEVLHRGQQGW